MDGSGSFFSDEMVLCIELDWLVIDCVMVMLR